MKNKRSASGIILRDEQRQINVLICNQIGLIYDDDVTIPKTETINNNEFV